jgi:AraC-like DNA-binding protein
MDALAAIVTLLKPQAVGAKIIHGAGRWGVRYPAFGQPSFALVLKGPCWLAADGFAATILETGDFVLFPAMPGFTLASDPEVKPKSMTPNTSEQVEEIFHGDATTEPSVNLLGGYFAFDPINASLLLDLLPRMLHIRATEPTIGNVATIVELIQREAREKRAGRALVLTRLIEIMLVEGLRSVPSDLSTSGLLAGLRDPQLAAAVRGIHTQTAHPWTLATLAREAGMSRSSFAERFARVIGMTPLNYLLQWRIAVAKNMLAHEQKSVAETAIAVGYESASGFSTAFSRETGRPPKEFIGA